MADNLSDALIMAGAILIFVIALTVSMSSFTTMRSQIDEIIEYDYKLDLATDSSGKLLNYFTADSDIREVGVETVVSSMYRVVKENYIVYIAGLDSSDIPPNVTPTKLEDDQYYLKADGTKEKIIEKDKDVIEISINNKNSNVNALLEGGLYKELKGKKFKEYLGVYQEATDESVDEVNKTTYRVITYVVQPL